ncbi:hypothetical protein D1BOALGB6SA_715 [Olavius sp. associated proteobacterium Delta 1]|nr:hypothetical protein D1BOALGB6SA_715 [Olavius sp. associated proteobacterium Delta 1]
MTASISKQIDYKFKRPEKKIKQISLNGKETINPYEIKKGTLWRQDPF